MNILKKNIKFILSIMPLKWRISIRFLYEHGYLVSYKKPTTFSEKIQIRKLSIGKSESFLADKFLVREYVSKKIGDEYLIPLLWECKACDFDDFPVINDDAVIKTNHGSGSKHLEFLPSKLTPSQLREKFVEALSEGYIGELFGENQYKYIDRRVLIEKKLNLEGDVPSDFKFHVFRNDGSSVWFLQIDFDRFTDHKRNYYDSELNLLDVEVIYSKGSFSMPSREVVNRMGELSIELLGNMEYARVDLYYLDHQIYFGEITLTPGSGFEKFSSRQYDEEWGNLWK